MTHCSTRDENSSYEVADVMRLYGEDYRSSNGVTKKQQSVMHAIEGCRTSQFGYHVDQCDRCGHTDEQYNSCRDRHCPKCQGISRRKWVKARVHNILPVAYYHVVFTLPHLLHSILLYNRKLIYDLLFDCASKTLLRFGKDPKWLGGQIGFYGILHSWGQTLWQHAHIHFIVPAGALTEDGRWIEPRYKTKFLFPVHALSKVFRGKFVEGLKTSYYRGDLVIPEDAQHLRDTDQFEEFINRLVSKNWVVYCKPPFGNADKVIRYLGRYSHRVAISNRRIIEVENGRVCFRYKAYKGNKFTWKQMTLEAPEFIRRFLWHILPEGFHKIRHYGYLANGRCEVNLARIRNVLGANAEVGTDLESDDNVLKCPECGKGFLRPIAFLNRYGRIVFASFNKNKLGFTFDTS